jgi:hypothetical protein
MAPVIPDNWAMNWMWGLPLIVFIVILHAAGLGIINKKLALRLEVSPGLGELSATSILVVAAVVLAVTTLHGLEGLIWAVAYRMLGALHDYKSAVLFSLNAITSYGHEDLRLERRWELMGALEALNGCIMFGLTTGYLFLVMRRALYQSKRTSSQSTSRSTTPS